MIKRRVYVLSNAGAEDWLETGPVTVAEARKFILDREEENEREFTGGPGPGDHPSQGFFTVAASRYDRYERTHTVNEADEEEENDDNV